MTAVGEWGDPSKEKAPSGYYWSLESPNYGNGPAFGNALGYKLRQIIDRPSVLPSYPNQDPKNLQLAPKDPGMIQPRPFNPIMWHPMHPYMPYMPPTKYPVGETRPGYLGGPEPPRPTLPQPVSGSDSLIGMRMIPKGGYFDYVPLKAGQTSWSLSEELPSSPPIKNLPQSPTPIGTGYYSGPWGPDGGPLQPHSLPTGYNVKNLSAPATIGNYGGKKKGKKVHMVSKKVHKVSKKVHMVDKKPKKQEKIFYGI